MTRIHSYLSIRPCATASEEPTWARFVPRAWLLLFAGQFIRRVRLVFRTWEALKHEHDAPGGLSRAFETRELPDTVHGHPLSGLFLGYKCSLLGRIKFGVVEPIALEVCSAAMPVERMAGDRLTPLTTRSTNICSPDPDLSVRSGHRCT